MRSTRAGSRHDRDGRKLISSFEPPLRLAEKAFVDLLVDMQQVTEKVDETGQVAFFADNSDPWKPVVDNLVNDFGLTGCAHDE